MSWVEQAERALSGEKIEGVVVVRGARGPLLDAESIRGLIAPFLAAVLWASAIFRETIAGTSIDPLALGLRIVALAFTLRVFVLGKVLFEKLGTWIAAPNFALVLTPEGLLYRTPRMDTAVPKDAIVGVLARGSWQERAAGARSVDVYVVVDPALGRTHLAIPPVLDETPGRLAERLMRWRGGIEEREGFEHPPPNDSASRVYEDAAAGKVIEGAAIVRHGRRWMTKGPYLVVVAAIAVGEGLVRGGPRVWEAIGPAVGGGLVLALLAVFGRWLWMTRRDVAPQKGLSMVLTPAELLIRTRHGVVRTHWPDLVRASPASKRAWSVLEGAHDARQLVITRRGAGPIRYEEPYMGIPIEVAQVLMDAYKAGTLPRGSG